MKILSMIPEMLKPSVLFNGQPTLTPDVKGIKPVGSDAVVMYNAVTMGNAADLTLSLVTADDADGTNPVAITQDVPVFVDNVRQTSDAKSHTISDDTGVFTVCFCVPPILIPEGKYLCVSYGASNDANVLSTSAFVDGIYSSEKA